MKDGSPLDMNRRYNVFAFGYMAGGGDGYTMLTRPEVQEIGDGETRIPLLRSMLKKVSAEPDGTTSRIQQTFDCS